MKIRFISVVSALFLVLSTCFSLGVHAEGFVIDEQIPSAVLMELETGTVLYEKDADTQRQPASVTKVMTMLLIMEAVDSGKISMDEIVTVSAYASSMGGSQVYLKEGEQMSVEDMLKSITVASANDACVAMAEHIAGSEESFVSLMNQRAAELGMANTNFENTNGLDDTTTSHYTTARDIAIMSRELLKHKKILDFSSIWMDSIRNGEFGLTNTNRLIRFYKGANGLKTGSTSKAGFCISATAERDGMTLICVIMGAPTRDVRNEAAKKALDFGFANYGLYTAESQEFPDFPVIRGKLQACKLTANGFKYLGEKGSIGDITVTAILPESLIAPIKAGETVGTLVYSLGDQKIGDVEIKAAEDVEEITYIGMLGKLIKKFLMV